jgi:hypothetical protein
VLPAELELSDVDPSVADPPDVVLSVVESVDVDPAVVEPLDVDGSVELDPSDVVATDALSAVEVVSAVVGSADGVGSTGAEGSPVGDGVTVPVGVEATGATVELGGSVVGAVDVCVGGGAMLGSTTFRIRASNSSSLASISAGSSVPDLIRAS